MFRYKIKKLFLIGIGLTFLFNIFLFADSTISFFYNQSLQPMIGLNCQSENECKLKCQNKESCLKAVKPCLNCIGARSPYLSDFFNNVNELTTACLDHGYMTSRSEDLFKYVSMVPLFSISAYNPLGLKDFSLMLKFVSLCPAGIIDPTAIIFSDPLTHSVLDIPLIQCGKTIYPLVRMGEDCAEKADQVDQFIKVQKEKDEAVFQSYSELQSRFNPNLFEYDVLPYSDYIEGQYIKCGPESTVFCQKLCQSSVSCSHMLNKQNVATGIAHFNHEEYIDCGLEKMKIDFFMNYLNDDESFSFNGQSLQEKYELPKSNGGFQDLGPINSILKDYAGVFQTDKNLLGSFYISGQYQVILNERMKKFCDPLSSPYVLGHKGEVERIFCKNSQGSYVKILAKSGEDCAQKIGRLSNENY